MGTTEPESGSFLLQWFALPDLMEVVGIGCGLKWWMVWEFMIWEPFSQLVA
jgi:hypothetical protein